MKQRIQKLLAAAGVASRRKVEEMLLQGRISVNGKVVTRLPVLIEPGVDKVAVDDEPVRLAKFRGGGSHGGARAETSRGAADLDSRLYILLNKPKGVYCTNVAQGEQRLAIDLLPPGLPPVHPAGRLDAQSKGLLLLTNDGELMNQLTHPRYGVPKTYRALVDGFVGPQTLDELQKELRGEESAGAGGAQIKLVNRSRDKSVLEITLLEGPNREIRKLLAKIGHKVRDLTRIRIGPLALEALAPGQSRLLTSTEVRRLRKWSAERAEFKESVKARHSRARRRPRQEQHEDSESQNADRPDGIYPA
ncbi:MAG: pseudouridine synthase [Tepidisphaeraceae bacterium]|jgi:23S rRNA pseudouridine2605 synthase